jgi:hypothetical protein
MANTRSLAGLLKDARAALDDRFRIEEQESAVVTAIAVPDPGAETRAASYVELCCSKSGRGSPARALGLALLQALHVGVFRELRLGRAQWQPGLAVLSMKRFSSEVRA